MKSARGFTLVETMVAGTILALVTLALFEGITVAARISRESAEMLQAEGIAWDAVWTAFNEDYDLMLAECRKSDDGTTSTRTVTLPESAAPLLSRYDTSPTLSVTLTKTEVEVDESTKYFIAVEGDVTWGSSANRRRLSDTQRTFVWRSPMGRVGNY